MEKLETAESERAKSPRRELASGEVTAKNRAVAIGGDAIGTTIVTGDHNTVQQTSVDLQTFLDHLADLRRQVCASALPAETAEVIEAEIVGVETQACKAKPNRAAIAGKLQTVLGVLKDAAAVGTALTPAAVKLGEWAARLF